MFYVQQIENDEYEAAYNYVDRFQGFDRGDLDDNDYPDQGQRVIGRMTNGAGQRVLIVEQYCDDMRNYQIFVGGNCVFDNSEDRTRAIRVARWWMNGCPA